MSAPNDIVLFWYSASPYGRRVQWYLTLRNIAFAECVSLSRAIGPHSARTYRQLHPNLGTERTIADHCATIYRNNRPSSRDPTSTPSASRTAARPCSRSAATSMSTRA